MKPASRDASPEETITAAAQDQHRQHGSHVTSQERVDEAMAESFPASDPPSWNAGLKHKEDDLTEDTSESKT